MKILITAFCALTILIFGGTMAIAKNPTANKMILGIQATLSPDGKRMAFVWGGDVWIGDSQGGRVRQLTQHPAQEWTPKFSPDGKEIAFVSERDGSMQIYVVPVAGGVPEKLTAHSEGYYLLGWNPDGKSLIARGGREHVGRRGYQLLRVSRERFADEEALFDGYGVRADISPDGERVLFTREGVDLYRKGYRGSQASQVWMYEFAKKEYTQLVKEDGGARSPQWRPDGKGFYYVAQRGGAFNLIERDLDSGDEKLLTSYVDDGVVRPTISRDGNTVVFRRGIDFYRMRLGGDGEQPKVRKCVFHHRGDVARHSQIRRLLKSASEVSFSRDGLEIAFVAGGDVWVMDTVLREPKRVTETPAEERELMFSKDGDSIYYLSDTGATCKLWRALREDDKRYWWQNDEFDLALVTDGAEIISNVSLSPDGKRLAFVKGLGDLWVTDLKGVNGRRILQSWSPPSYDWSPDGAWLAYSVDDDDFNRDIWIAAVDGSMLPYNVSRHPDWEGEPRWSPDGKLLAFVGRRHGEEVDIFYVWLQKQDDQLGGRDRSETEAIDKMTKARKTTKPASPAKPAAHAQPFKGLFESLKRISEQRDEPQVASDKKSVAKESKTPIDFDDLSSRVRKVSIPDAAESRLFWSPDSKKLAFAAKINGKEGIYSVEFPNKLSPSLLVAKSVGSVEWLAKDDRIVYLEKGVPGSFSKGKFSSYPFSAAQTYDQKAKFRVAFQQIWRAMRDRFYDGNHGGKDWDVVREKYQEAASSAVDLVAFENVVAMVLGELNGSHLGFRASASLRTKVDSGDWVQQTGHLGVTVDERGGKLVVKSVILGGPAARESSRLMEGDVLVSVDATEVKARSDLLLMLNGLPGKRVDVVVQRGGEKLAPMIIPTISYAAARSLQQVAWVESNRHEVERRSKGRLGYLHVSRMMWEQFENFEREVFAVGAGKEGIVIDVRDNGGGFTADHLLTVLMTKDHAFTVPRGGGVGYPGSRRVYWTWNKPIVVLCNQNSFSNAEIFAHAIKTLGRGKVVGVPTAGGVISTGSATIMDIGSLRIPFRGWFKSDDGEDMELNGAVPGVVVWPQPGDFSQGIDRQLSKAVDVLEKDVETYLARPKPQPRKASERG
ncbi:MAG: tricorn protease [Verrucomicrobiales bacterium]|jgi:tricorn protease